MSIEGEITVKVTIDFDSVKEVSITSSRPLHITQLFAEQPIQKVATTLDALYQLCNTAHRFAFLRLLSKCKVIGLSQNEITAYQLLLDLETIREHCFSIATKWCMDDNQTINKSMIDLLTTIRAISSSLFSSGSPLSLEDKALQPFSSIQPLVAKLEEQLIVSLIGKEFSPKCVFDDSGYFDHWIETQSSDCAIFLHHIQQSKFKDLGNAKTNFLPNIATKELVTLLNNNAFISQPSYQNSCYETTPYARQNKHLLMQQLLGTYGSGVFARSSAQLLEVFELLKRVKNNYTQIHNEHIHYEVNISVDTMAMVDIDAARGKLIHALTIKDEKIKAYRILSPTQWNFHPQGVLKQMITSINFENKQDLNAKIKLLVNAIDPCVGYQIEVVDA